MQTTPQILQMLNGAGANQLTVSLAQIKQMIGTIRSTGNPQAFLQRMIQERNPALAQAMEYVKQSGGDPHAAFCRLAAEKGIDPKEIEEMMR